MIARVMAIFRRYALIHIKSPARLMDLFFWPVMELLVWGFFTIYLQQKQMDSGGRWVLILLNALIFWDILFRTQQSLSLAFMEELWTRNVLNLLIAPLRTVEWVLGAYLYGLAKTGIIVATLWVLAAILYHFNITVLGFYIVPLAFQLLLFGYSMGLATTGLLLRWGHAAEALIWGIPFLIQPFSAIFYPLSVYPRWLKPVALILPSTHVMEGMRQVVETGKLGWDKFWWAFLLNAVHFILFTVFCVRMLERGRDNGQLVRMTG